MGHRMDNLGTDAIRIILGQDRRQAEASQVITDQSLTANQYNKMMLDTDMNTSVNGANDNPQIAIHSPS